MALMNPTMGAMPPATDDDPEYTAAVQSGDLQKLFSLLEREQGLPAGYLRKTAQIESRMNPNAQNPKSSAGGLFQQTNGNARQYGIEDKFDPVQSALGAAMFAGDNANYLSSKLGRDPTAGELYLAHQQGPKGALALLSNPNAPAASVVGSAAAGLNGGSGLTAGQLASKWTSKLDNPADLPAEGAIPVSMDSGKPGFNIPPGGSPGLMNKPAYEPYKPADEGFGVGDTISAIGQALMSGTRQNPLGNFPAILAAQDAARAKREDRRYGMYKDDRDFSFRQTESDRAQGNSDRGFGLQEKANEQGVTRDARDFDFRKSEADRNQGNTTFNQGIARESLDTSKADKAADNEREDKKLEFQKQAALDKAAQDKALPADLAGRMALTQVFLEKAPEIRKDLADGAVTGAWDAGKAEFGIGRPGEIMRQLKSGRDGLQRALTGAGMPASEAAEYADRYLPKYTDSSEKVLSKFDQLTEELTRYRDIATRGRGGVSAVQAKPSAGTAAQPNRQSAADRFQVLMAQPGATKEQVYQQLHTEGY